MALGILSILVISLTISSSSGKLCIICSVETDKPQMFHCKNLFSQYVLQNSYLLGPCKAPEGYTVLFI